MRVIVIGSSVLKTKHFQRRVSQRSIRNACIELTLACGKKDGDKTTFNRKQCRQALEELERMKKALIHIQSNGGYTVVEEDGALITVYRNNSYSRNKARQLLS